MAEPAAGPRPGLDLAALAATEVTGADGRPVRIGTLWRDRPLALVFLRHFG